MTTAPRRILIIEDDPLQAELFADMLAMAFPEAAIQKAATAEQALALALPFQPQVVIADGNLPGGVSGCAAVGRLRSLVPPFKALLVSGCWRELGGSSARVFDAALEKPVRMAQLLSVVRAWM